MTWITLLNNEQLNEIKQKSFNTPQVIFKHSTRCSISSMAKSRLERSTQPEDISFYYLDLIKYRSLSSEVAREFSVAHESPQILLIKNGECIFTESHSGIDMEDIIDQALAA